MGFFILNAIKNIEMKILTLFLSLHGGLILPCTPHPWGPLQDRGAGRERLPRLLILADFFTLSVAQSERTAYKSIGFSLFKLRLCSQNQNKKLQHISGADASGGQIGQIGQIGQQTSSRCPWRLC